MSPPSRWRCATAGWRPGARRSAISSAATRRGSTAHGVARAAIESLAENFSDGVVAPVFWYLLGGLPGLFAYKMANTLDSMIGHRSERYRAFGWAAARFDDLLNLVPARLSGLLLAAAALFAGEGAAGREPCRRCCATRRKHHSPNAGWPEAAMAGALGLALAGPRHYAEGSSTIPGSATARRAATTGRYRPGVAAVLRSPACC